jgi:hypothetical protein
VRLREEVPIPVAAEYEFRGTGNCAVGAESLNDRARAAVFAAYLQRFPI